MSGQLGFWTLRVFCGWGSIGSGWPIVIELGFHPAIWLCQEGGHEKHFLRAAKEMSELGWDGFEYAGKGLEEYYGREKELKRILSDLDLELCAFYCANAYVYPEKVREELEQAKRKADFLAKMGNQPILLIDGGAKREGGNTDEDLRMVAEGANHLGRIAKARGLTAVWHQHWGTILEHRDPFYRFMEWTDPELVYFCPDTAQLSLGDFDLIEVFTRFADRIRYIHFKDLDANRRFIENGRGIIDFPTLWRILQERNYEGWITVDLDYTQFAPKHASALCKRYLNEVLGIEGRRDQTMGLA